MLYPSVPLPPVTKTLFSKPIFSTQDNVQIYYCAIAYGHIHAARCGAGPLNCELFSPRWYAGVRDFELQVVVFRVSSHAHRFVFLHWRPRRSSTTIGRNPDCGGALGIAANVSSTSGHKNIHQCHLLFKEGRITEMTLFTNELTINQRPGRSQYAAGGRCAIHLPRLVDDSNQHETWFRHSSMRPARSGSRSNAAPGLGSQSRSWRSGKSCARNRWASSTLESLLQTLNRLFGFATAHPMNMNADYT